MKRGPLEESTKHNKEFEGVKLSRSSSHSPLRKSPLRISVTAAEIPPSSASDDSDTKIISIPPLKLPGELRNGESSRIPSPSRSNVAERNRNILRKSPQRLDTSRKRYVLGPLQDPPLFQLRKNVTPVLDKVNQKPRFTNIRRLNEPSLKKNADNKDIFLSTTIEPNTRDVNSPQISNSKLSKFSRPVKVTETPRFGPNRVNKLPLSKDELILRRLDQQDREIASLKQQIEIILQNQEKLLTQNSSI